MTDERKAELARQVGELKKTLDLTWDEMALRLGVKKGITVYQWSLEGAQYGPSVDSLLRLARLAGEAGLSTAKENFLRAHWEESPDLEAVVPYSTLVTKELISGRIPTQLGKVAVINSTVQGLHDLLGEVISYAERLTDGIPRLRTLLTVELGKLKKRIEQQNGTK